MPSPAHFLLTHFDRLAEAPGGIAKLRALVLQLAINGKLGTHNPKDEPTSKRFKKAAPKQTENPLLMNWECWRMLDLVTVQYGFAFDSNRFSDSGKGIPLIRIRDIRRTSTTVSYTGEYDSAYLVEPGDYLVGMDGDFNIAEWRGPRALLNQRVCRFKNFTEALLPKFLFYCIQQHLAEIHAATSFVTVKHLSAKQLNTIVLSLPPLAEQRRIVGKVEELMALCDTLESAQRERESIQARLRASALHQFASPDSDSKSAAFVLQHLPNLTAAPEYFASLRDAMRDAAVLGLFSADSSLWKRTQLGEQTAVVTSGSRGWAEYYSNSGALFVRAQNIKKNGRLMLDSVAYVDLPKNSEGTRTRIERDDLVVVITGAGVTQSARVQQDFDEAYVSQHVALIRLKEPACAPWISLQLLAKASARGKLEAQIYGGKPALNLTNIRELEISLPPLAEQRRIVAKVDELMAVLDALEATLTSARTTAERLLAATIARLHGAEEAAQPVLAAAEEPGPYGEAVKVAGFTTSLAFTRAALAAEIVHRMHGDRTFGQIKFQKALYLAEYVAQLSEIDSHPERYQNGPHDPKLIAQVEAKMKEYEWFEAVPRAGGHGNEYHSLAQAGRHQKHFERLWPTKAATIRKLIDEMKTWKTERCERFATLYAAWNDLIIWNKPTNDTAILDQVLKHWHTAKQQIPKSSWQDMLGWMRREAYVPTGWGRATKTTPEAELFPSQSI